MGLGDKPGSGFKIGACCCLTTVLIIGLCFMSFYWGLYNTAAAYDENAANTLTYDQCGGVFGEEDLVKATGWTQAFKFQAILYTIMVTIYSVSILSLCIPFVNQCIMCCQICTICPMVAAIILTGVRRLNTSGSVCAANTTDIVDTETGDTFATNGQTMKAIFIAQCVMYLPTVIAASVSIQLSIMGEAMNATHNF